MKVLRGWTIAKKKTLLRSSNGSAESIVYEVVNKRKGIKKVFISEEAVDRFLKTMDYERTEQQALAGKGAPSPSKGAILMATKDIVAANELGEYAV